MDNLKELIEEMHGGDLLAFERLVTLFEDRIYTYVLRLVGNRDDAADLVQETFLKLYRHRHKLKAEENVKSFLYTIATNVTRDYWRKTKRERLLRAGDDEMLETIADESTYSRIETHIVADDVLRALGALRPLYKTVLVLYYEQGFSYEEIAKLLDAPLNSVKTYLRRAKAAFKDELTKTKP